MLLLAVGCLTTLPLPGWAGGENVYLSKDPSLPGNALPSPFGANEQGSVFKNPGAFVEWLDAIIEPRFVTALGTVNTEPGVKLRNLARQMDPNTTRSWAEFSDPYLCLRWLLASPYAAAQAAILRRETDGSEKASPFGGNTPASSPTVGSRSARTSVGPAAGSQSEWLHLPGHAAGPPAARLRY